jgi:hypothetical protein
MPQSVDILALATASDVSKNAVREIVLHTSLETTDGIIKLLQGGDPYIRC